MRQRDRNCGIIGRVTDAYPRLYATTGRFTHGAPTSFTISPDDQRLVFLRSQGPEDPVRQLMVMPKPLSPAAEAKVVADAQELGADDSNLSPQERARRERLREGGAGIVGYATDKQVTVASFAVGGMVGIADLIEGSSRLLDITGPAVDPRVDPTGKRVAWVADRALWVCELDGANQVCLAAPESQMQSWGSANFLAAEEFDRVRGFWWAPDGQTLLVEEFDEDGVDEWYISDPANPAVAAAPVRYPAAGKANPAVRLWLIDLAGTRTQVQWDTEFWEYVVSANWSSYGPPLVRLYDRTQKHAITLAIDPGTGQTTQLARDENPAWVSDLPGTPRWAPGGALVTTHQNETESIAIDGKVVELGSANVAAIVDCTDRGLLLELQPTAPTAELAFVDFDGKVHPLPTGRDYTTGAIGSYALLTISTDLEDLQWHREIRPISKDFSLGAVVNEVTSLAAQPPLELNCELIKTGKRELNTVLLWPRDHVPGSRKLPVIMNPYGGPHAQRALAIGRAHATAQWMADQGYAVVVTDGRGSPGRGPQWEREICNGLGAIPLADQVDSIQALLENYPDDLDPQRVGITGWSFGGYLAALAVLERPDVFHCAVAGAPVTDWCLYDTAYTERYLGDPLLAPENYSRSCLLPLAKDLQHPLMIIHGMSDDNVVVAHSLQLSGALTAAGKSHTFLPLSNVTHMTPQVEVAENLLRLQVMFFARNL